MIDLYSVLELVQIAKIRITDEEVQALHDVIAEMSDYIRRTENDKEDAELIRLGRQITGMTTR